MAVWRSLAGCGLHSSACHEVMRGWEQAAGISVCTQIKVWRAVWEGERAGKSI